MTMTYEDAIQVWGKKKLAEAYQSYKDTGALVVVKFDLDPGYTNTDPESYGSFDEPPRYSVDIKQGRWYTHVPLEYFDFAEVIREVVVAGGGTLTA